MSSPFPGMDPYLEAPDEWQGVHNSMITYMMEDLNRRLPDSYVARLDARLYGEEPKRSIVPDVALLKRLRIGATPRQGGSVTLLEPVSKPETFTVLPLEFNESFINIRTLTKPRRIITVIEILSPANKSGGAGRRAYLQKQREILESDANLLEVDLLRRGRHTVSAPREGILRFGAWDYLACLNRADSRETYEFWRIGLRQRLPQLLVPLAEGEPDVTLDLQAAFDRVYDGGRFLTNTDYDAPPVVAVEGENAEWMDALLRDKGLRTAAGNA